VPLGKCLPVEGPDNPQLGALDSRSQEALERPRDTRLLEEDRHPLGEDKLHLVAGKLQVELADTLHLVEEDTLHPEVGDTLHLEEEGMPHLDNRH